MQEKIAELRRTIQFLCNTMTNAADQIEQDPGLVKMMLRESVDDPRYEFK